MNKIILYTVGALASAFSSFNLTQANVQCPNTAIPLEGLAPEETGYYRNICQMQIDFENNLLVPLNNMPTYAEEFGARQYGVNSLTEPINN